MDKISEFFKELKDRVSNPLFFSFIIGWIGFNWKIVIGLLFYSIQQLQKDGYSSYQNLILTESNFYCSFLWPFLIALGYTFVFPIFRNLIHMSNAWNQKWGTEKTLSILKDGKISVSKYIQLREVYEKRRLTIEEVLQKESEFVTENERLKSELSIRQSKINAFEKEKQHFQYMNDINRVMDGDWWFKIGDEENNTRVIISQGKVYSNKGFKKDIHLYNIDYISFNPDTYGFIIIFTEVKDERKYAEIFWVQPDFKIFKNKSNKGRITLMKKDD